MILEELNRMKYLFGYQKGRVISEQVKQDVQVKAKAATLGDVSAGEVKKTSSQSREEGKLTTSTVTEKNFSVPLKNLVVPFDTGKAEPKDVPAFINQVKDALMSNEQVKNTLSSGGLVVKSIYLQAGASNSWGIPTAFDYDGAYKKLTQVKMPDEKLPKVIAAREKYKDKYDKMAMDGYNSNLELATKRGTAMINKIKTDLPKQIPGLQITTETKETVTPIVVDTQGWPDDETSFVDKNKQTINKPKLNPGQVCKIVFYFGFAESATEVITEVDKVFGTYLVTGSQFCNGYDGANASVTSNPNWCKKNGVCQSPKAKDGKESCSTKGYQNSYMYTADLKWNITGTGPKDFPTSSYVYPSFRLTFTWDNGKIVKVTTSVPAGNQKSVGKGTNIFSEAGINVLPGQTLTQEQTAIVCRLFMNKPKFSPEGKQTSPATKSFETYVEPYLNIGGGETQQVDVQAKQK